MSTLNLATAKKIARTTNTRKRYEMSSGDLENKILRPTEDRLYNLYAQHRGLYQWTGMPYRLDHSHHVPYLGGIAETGDPVYIDKDIPLCHMISGRMCPIDKYIAVHERFEWWLVKNLHMPYEQAHIWANTAESWAVEGDGWRYANYNYVVEKNAKTIKTEKPIGLPPGLAAYPYYDEPKILEAIRRAT